MTLMERRRALMAAVEEETQIALVDGQYMSGTLTVTNGKTFAIDIQPPPPSSFAVIPLTKEITVHSGDVISILFSARPGLKDQTWGVTVSGVNKNVITASKPIANLWYNATTDADGTLTGIRVERREAYWVANFDLSLKINDEVIF